VFLLVNVAGMAAAMVGCAGKGLHSLLATLFLLRSIGFSQLWRGKSEGMLGFGRGLLMVLEHRNAVYALIRVPSYAFSLRPSILTGCMKLWAGYRSWRWVKDGMIFWNSILSILYAPVLLYFGHCVQHLATAARFCG